MSVKVLNWNIEWAKRRWPRGEKVANIISDQGADIVCLTETYADFFQDPNVISSNPDYGYQIIDGRRKVLMWSRNPWRDIDPIGNEQLPSGRFVAGTTSTAIGDVRVVGVCIPWSAAHVSTGRKDRQRWGDHESYLRGLREIISSCSDMPLLVIGDFNQTVPRTWAPNRVFQLLDTTFSTLQFATAGLRDVSGKPAIDHICHSHDLNLRSVQTVPNHIEGTILSDHFGVACSFVAT